MSHELHVMNMSPQLYMSHELQVAMNMSPQLAMYISHQLNISHELQVIIKRKKNLHGDEIS